MNVSEIFIRRPVMTTLVMLAFVLAGAFGYTQLSVSELPSIDYPTVQVQARLPGANAETMATSVATPLEKQFSTIAGIDSMNSSSSQGITNITVTFDLDRNIDAAAQDVQAALSATIGLPRDMPQQPTIKKQNPSDQPILMMKLSSETLPISEVNKYAEDLIVPKMSTLEGVSQVEIQGQARQAVRIQVDPDALAARGIGIDQVVAAVRATNVNLATGQLDGNARSAIINTQGQLFRAEEYKRQIIAYRNNSPVRLGDIANVVDAIENVRMYGAYNGKPSINLNVRRQPGANTVAVVDKINEILPSLRDQLPPSVKLETAFDRSQSIRASIEDVQLTLIGSALLVVGVIFLFLRSASATFIPSVAMPIAIIGAFAGMAAFGYSLDNLSLLALTLSVIFIVDDAIVMLENIMRHIEAGESAREASIIGSKEVSGTILTMTLSLAAVFIPVLFMGGILGRLLHEFAVTIVLAIMVSGVVSVTLTPMLCSRIIKTKHEQKPSKFHERSERIFNRIQNAYERSLRLSLDYRRVVLGIFVASLVLTIVLFRMIPQDFLPADDVNNISGGMRFATGTSFAAAKAHQQQVEAIIRADQSVTGVSSFVINSNGFMTVYLLPRSQRPGRMSIDNVIASLNRKVSVVPGIQVFLQNPPSVRLGGQNTRLPYQYTMTSSDRNELYTASEKLKAALQQQTSVFSAVDTNLDLAAPTVNIDIDRDAAARYGISVQQIETALGSAFAGSQISTMYTSTDQYQVILELLPQFQRDPSSVSRLYVTATDGTLVPVTAVTKITSGTLAQSENHLGQVPAVTISFGLQPGIPLSKAVEVVESTKTQLGLSASIQGSFQGTAQAFQQSMQGMGYLLIGGILVVYIVLGILYESFIHPLTILSGLPAAATGALLTLGVFHISLTLYAFVGMIMLIGIVKKNAIMMIDFALKRQRQDGLDHEEAIFEAAIVRFRPIMMTTMAALVGAVPIALGLGAGGEGRMPLGVAVVGGLVLSQALTLYITPVIYCYLDKAERWVHRTRGKKSPHHGAFPAQAE